MADMLSEHFSVAEFEYSATAKAKGIINKMSESQKGVAKHTAIYLLENIRKYVNQKYASKTVKCVIMDITSGFRSLALNKAVGGVNKPNSLSQHCKAEAADIVCTIVYTNGKKKVIPYTELYEIIKQGVKEKKLFIDQCIQECSGKDTWVHVSLCQQISQCRYQFLKYANKQYVLDCVLK